MLNIFITYMSMSTKMDWTHMFNSHSNICHNPSAFKVCVRKNFQKKCQISWRCLSSNYQSMPLDFSYLDIY